jgi:hypothetical protein
MKEKVWHRFRLKNIEELLQNNWEIASLNSLLEVVGYVA